MIKIPISLSYSPNSQSQLVVILSLSKLNIFLFSAFLCTVIQKIIFACMVGSIANQNCYKILTFEVMCILTMGYHCFYFISLSLFDSIASHLLLSKLFKILNQILKIDFIFSCWFYHSDRRKNFHRSFFLTWEIFITIDDR